MKHLLSPGLKRMEQLGKSMGKLTKYSANEPEPHSIPNRLSTAKSFEHIILATKDEEDEDDSEHIARLLEAAVEVQSRFFFARVPVNPATNFIGTI